MLGGLYGDLPPPSSSATDDDKSSSTPVSSSASVSVWSSSVKMAPPTLRKPPASFAPPPSLLRSQTKPKPSNLKPHPPAPPLPLPVDQPPPSFQPALVGVPSSVVEEYDPSRPNDYEDYRREKKKKAMEAEMRRELDKRRRQEEQLERENKRDSDSPGESRLNISGEEAWRRRAAMTAVPPPPRSPSPPPANADGFAIGKSETAGLGLGTGGNMTAAQRMMAKMGWKEGQGLGKQEQGITTPLVAKKTDRRAGVIVNASENNKQDKKVKSVNFNGPPTRVLLLRNMVGPGEVDDELEDEVGSECSKYGTVTRVVIFEITEPSFPTDEAVRIFVQFERSEETTKAYVDLDGRFFGGRIVKAAFYDEEMFNQNELAPLPGEVPGF